MIIYLAWTVNCLINHFLISRIKTTIHLWLFLNGLCARKGLSDTNLWCSYWKGNGFFLLSSSSTISQSKLPKSFTWLMTTKKQMTCLLTLIAIDFSQHKFRVDADLTRLVIWHFLVMLDLPPKISACFCRECILSEMRWNLARIIKFPSRRSSWINGRGEEERARKGDVKSFCVHIWKKKTPKSGEQELIFFTSGTDYRFVSIHCKAWLIQLCWALFICRASTPQSISDC